VVVGNRISTIDKWFVCQSCVDKCIFTYITCDECRKRFVTFGMCSFCIRIGHNGKCDQKPSIDISTQLN